MNSQPELEEVEGPFGFIGRNIRELRKQKRWTQAELGQRLARRKLSRQAIGWIESGKNTDLETIADIASALGVDVTALVRVADIRRLDPPKTADQLANELLAGAPPSSDRRYASEDVLRKLLERVEFLFERDPTQSLKIATVATELVETLNSERRLATPELGLQSWKDLSHAKRLVGDNRGALQALEKADEAAAACRDPEYSRAVVEFVRTSVLGNLQQYSEAHRRLLAVRDVFKKRDRRRYLLTFHEEALLLGYMDPDAAVRLVDSVMEEMATLGEEDLQRFYTVVAHVYASAGKSELVSEYQKKAAEINARRGHTAEMVFDISRAGKQALDRGELDRAVDLLGRAKERLVALGIKDLETDFNYLQAKVAAGASARELHDLCAKLASDASAASLPITASEAIDWMRRISERLTAADVAMVYSVVREAQRDSSRSATQPSANAAGAEARVDELLAAPAAVRRSLINRDSRFQSPAVIQVLLRKADEVFEQDPCRVRELATIATLIADHLRDDRDTVTQELRVQAWKDLAHIASLQGDHEEALRHLIEAEAAARLCSNPNHQAAIVDFEHAIILYNMERNKEAFELLMKARKALENVDRYRYLLTFHQEAIMQAFAGNAHHAAVTTERLIAEMSALGDEVEVARLYTVAADAWQRAGEPERAAEYVRKAAEIHARRGATVEVALDILREAIMTGKIADPNIDYWAAREAVVRFGLKKPVIEADLQYLRARVAAGAPPMELHELCSRLAADASRADLPVTACEAIDWLRKIAGQITADDVAAVESFVSESAEHPDRRFEPPAS